jgi:hypothetical protein
VRTGSSGKIVVMLSSVAKPPPAGTPSLPRITPTGLATPTPVAPAPVVATPPPITTAPAVTIPVNPLPPKQVVPAKAPPTGPQLSTTTYVKLPPKTSAPGLVSLSGKPAAPTPTVAPPLPIKTPDAQKKSTAHLIPPIRLNEPVVAPEEPSEDSIFLHKQKPAPAPAPTPIVAKSPAPAPVPPIPPAPVVTPVAPTPTPAPIEAKAPAPAPTPLPAKVPASEPVSLDLFEKARPPAIKPPPPVTEAKDRPTLQPPQRITAPSGGLRPVRPPPLPIARTMPMGSTVTPPKSGKLSEPPAEKLPPSVTKPVEAPVAPIAPVSPIAALHVAPPMLEKAPEPPPAALTSAFQVAPPMLEKAPEPPPAEKLPPPIIIAKPAEIVEEAAAPVLAPLHVAPPMLEKAPEPIAEKLAQPHLPTTEARKAEPAPEVPEMPAPVLNRAPAMIKPEAKPDAPPKPAQPPSKPKRSITSWLKKKSQPIVVSSTSPKPLPTPIAETKPALKPPVLPARSLLTPTPIVEPPPVVEPPKIAEAKAPEKVAPAKLPPALPALKPPVLSSRSLLAATPVVEAPPVVEPPKIAETKAPEKAQPVKSEPVAPASAMTKIVPAMEAAVIAPAIVAAAVTDKKDKPVSKDSKAKPEPVKPPPSAPVEPREKKAAVPLTRAERAKKRRLVSTLFFWLLLFPATIAVLVVGSLRYGRDTRVEGQVIPPPGTVLSNEVWVVTDFRSLASGITEDLAAERTPILQDIQERQDHVQRAQADVASREERIRLIQEQISAAKTEIEGIVKQARDATQKIWDVDGAQIDIEYKSRMDQLQQTIADRAKSLKLNYQPDPAFNSPEVWANAYRLALYQVPAGVDGVKEHAWLSDQMKQWRDFQKSMDDRTEQLREQAAQVKLGPAPKIADLNSKMDELNQRIDATEAEEVPLKAELAQAQADLVTAQGADAGLDDKYYRQLYSLPGEAVLKRIPISTNGRFTWIDDNVFIEGEKEHSYYIFARATRADGRQYWGLGRISVEQNTLLPVLIEPPSFISTKAILRPNLSPDEQAQ